MTDDLAMWEAEERRRQAAAAPEATAAREARRLQRGRWTLLALSLVLGGVGAYLMLTTSSPIDILVERVTKAHAQNAGYLSPDCHKGLRGIRVGPDGKVTELGRESLCGVPYRSRTQFTSDALLLIWMPLFFAAVASLVPQRYRRRLSWSAAVVCAIMVIAAAFWIGSIDAEVFSAPIGGGASLPRVKSHPVRDLVYTQALAAVMTFAASVATGVLLRSRRSS